MKRTKREAYLAIFTIYCLILAVILFLRNGRDFEIGISFLSHRLNESANFLPFKTICNYISALQCGNVSPSVVRNNIIGNSVLFLPMGYLLPIVSRKRGFLKNTIIILIIIIMVEAVQLLTGLGSFDIDDVILNIAGSVIGYVAFFIVDKFTKKTDS